MRYPKLQLAVRVNDSESSAWGLSDIQNFVVRNFAPGNRAQALKSAKAALIDRDAAGVEQALGLAADEAEDQQHREDAEKLAAWGSAEEARLQRVRCETMYGVYLGYESDLSPSLRP